MAARSGSAGLLVVVALLVGCPEGLADALERLVEDGGALAQLGLGQLDPPHGLLGPVQELVQAAVEALVVPVPAMMVVPPLAARPVFVALLAAHLPGRLLQLGLEVSDAAPHLVADLAGQAVDRPRDLGLQLVQLLAPAGQLLAAGVGDPVDLAPALLALGDQALGLQALEPGVDGPRGGGVQAHEAVLQQPDHLIAVAWALVQQLEQVQSQPPVAEDGAHTVASGARRSRATWPEVLAARSRPPPAPSRPRAECQPGVWSCSSCSKALATWPVVDWSLTSRSLAPGRRTVRSPETLDRRMSRSPEAWRSRATAPETVRAWTDPPPPSATVRSPDTVRADRSPVTPEAWTGPDTDSASTGPRRPVRVTSPLTVCASTGASSPPTIRLADTTFSSTRQSRGTARVSTALRRWAPPVSQARGQGRHGRS